MAQGVKDPALSLLQLRSLLWRRFEPQPGTSICHRSSERERERGKAELKSPGDAALLKMEEGATAKECWCLSKLEEARKQIPTPQAPSRDQPCQHLPFQTSDLQACVGLRH